MGKVIADGENVVFAEGIPDSPRVIFDLVSQTLGDQRKAIVKFEVDQIDCLLDGKFPDSFKSIMISTMLHDEIILRISTQLLDQMNELENNLKAYQGNILSIAWSEVFKQMDQFINEIQPFADLIDNVAPYVQAYSPPWADKFTCIARDQADYLNLVLRSFEMRDPAGLSQCVGGKLVPLCKSTHSLFADEIIPYLKRIIEEVNADLSNDA